MKKVIVKTLITIGITIILLIITQGCSSTKFFHDHTHPCTMGKKDGTWTNPWFDANECAYYQEKFPERYQKYIKRIEKSKEKLDHF